VLLLAAGGSTNGQIAARLTVSTATVNTSLRLAYRTLGAHDRAHAVALAIWRGDISLSELAAIAQTANNQKRAAA
jgi:DNA-binding NarL/FixJ family response regulator